MSEDNLEDNLDRLLMRAAHPSSLFREPAGYRHPGDCMNRDCDQPFCPEHAEIDVWAGQRTIDVTPFRSMPEIVRHITVGLDIYEPEAR